ncbi:RAVE subunit 2/Rogdi [Rhexocercosporidium sp. MPI-PUGE-AT-0058]|nr:RAVE subunit 2/Rogdi [Rhexocercosporidium sp. MPI-PUGE-AT-0058]
MSTAVWPSLPAAELKIEEEASTARELSWLLDSLQETLVSLKSGLEECYALLAPIEPGSTLVMSSPRSENVKGHVTRVGDAVVRGTIHLRLKTLPHIDLTLQPTNPFPLPTLSHLRTLLNQSLDCIDITRWTGDRHSASFISSQLRLLHSIIREALAIIRVAVLEAPDPEFGTVIPTSGSSQSSSPGPGSASGAATNPNTLDWAHNPTSPLHFNPPLPPSLSLTLTPSSTSLLLTLRVLEPSINASHLGSRFAHAIGAQRRLEHDEMDGVYMFRGEEVRVKEKVVVESSADPTLLSLGAKLGALERGVGGMRGCLRAVMGEGEE